MICIRKEIIGSEYLVAVMRSAPPMCGSNYNLLISILKCRVGVFGVDGDIFLYAKLELKIKPWPNFGDQ